PGADRSRPGHRSRVDAEEGPPSSCGGRHERLAGAGDAVGFVEGIGKECDARTGDHAGICANQRQTGSPEPVSHRFSHVLEGGFQPAMKIARHFALPVLCSTAWLAGVATVHAADLHANTTAAFDRYVRLTEMRLNEERRGTIPFLWIDGLTEVQRQDANARLPGGEGIVS